MTAEKSMTDTAETSAAKPVTTYGIALCPDGARTFEVTASFDESVIYCKLFLRDLVETLIFLVIS